MKDRLKRKCIAGSSLLHGLLLCAFLFGSAFFKPKTTPPLPPPVLVMVNLPVSDKPSTGGGSPEPQPVAPVVQPQPQPQPTPLPPPPDPVKIPDPPKVAKVKPPPDPAPEKPADKPILPVVKEGKIAIKDPEKKRIEKPKTHEVQVDLDKLVDTGAARREAAKKQAAEERKQEEADRKAYQDRLSALRQEFHSASSSVADNVRNSGASGAVVIGDLPGPGGSSGAAFANYRDAIYSRYFIAWTAPDDVMSSDSTVSAKIVVARDGSIISAIITNRSHNKALDESVAKALRKVDHLPAFPADTSDTERSFEIIFDLQAKKSNG